jgi:hypothetical protein
MRAVPFKVTGTIRKDHTELVMTGRAPMYNRHCRLTGHKRDTLVFNYMGQETARSD